jgi:hypothetical protein
MNLKSSLLLSQGDRFARKNLRPSALEDEFFDLEDFTSRADFLAKVHTYQLYFDQSCDFWRASVRDDGTRLSCFYAGIRPDDRGRFLREILRWPDRRSYSRPARNACRRWPTSSKT